MKVKKKYVFLAIVLCIVVLGGMIGIYRISDRDKANKIQEKEKNQTSLSVEDPYAESEHIAEHNDDKIDTENENENHDGEVDAWIESADTTTSGDRDDTIDTDEHLEDNKQDDAKDDKEELTKPEWIEGDF